MKIAQDNVDVTLSGVSPEGEFKIRNSAKAFSILSSGLYSNKIKAIVRELSCNAWDSHKEAGKADVPFDCHVPTVIEPFFSIRDYGIGLDHEGVTQIYTTYFESTKADSNEFIGALGLGSKSPFSYTDNFTVSAIKNGVKRIYTAYINENGVPSIGLMDESDTDEGNGVEVSFPVVDTGDFRAFGSYAETIYKWFPVVPNFTGKKVDVERGMKYQIEDYVPGVHVTKFDTSYALQGNVLYPINRNLEVFNEYRDELHYGLLIEFDIGELDVAASREELSYIPLTVNSIIERLKLVRERTKIYAREQLDVVPTNWERMMAGHKLGNDTMFKKPVASLVADGYFKFMPYFDHGTNTRGSRDGIGSYGDIYLSVTDEDLDNLGITMQMFVSMNWERKIRKQKTPRFMREARPGEDADRHGEVAFTRQDVPIQNKTLFVVNDWTKSAGTRLIKHFKGNEDRLRSCSQIVLLDGDKKDRKEKIEAFLESIGSPSNVMYVSELDDHSVPKGQVQPADVCLMDKNPAYTGYSSQSPYKFKKVDAKDVEDDTRTYYYVPIKGYTASDERVPEKYRSMPEFTLMITRSFGFKPEVYAVRKGGIAAVKQKANWINIVDYLEEECAKLDPESLYEMYVTSRATTQFLFDDRAIPLLMEALPHDHKILEVARIVKKVTDSNSYYQQHLSKYADKIKFANKMFNRTFVLDSVQKRAYNSVDELFTPYPMLSMVDILSSQVDRRSIGSVTEYINLIDSTTGEK